MKKIKKKQRRKKQKRQWKVKRKGQRRIQKKNNAKDEEKYKKIRKNTCKDPGDMLFPNPSFYWSGYI